MAISLPRDANRVATIGGTSSVDGVTVVAAYVNPANHRLLVDLPGGSGTVTSVSVVSANGFAGTVASATTTPAITLTTSITGVLKGNGTSISSATDGTDYLSPTTGITVSQSTPQTLGVTGSRLLKLWATDITVTNAIVGSITGNAATVTTNANLTGVITSSGNATSIASQTGTGTKFVVDTSPTLVTPTLGVALATSINGNTFTTGTYTLTGTAAKTLTFNNSLTLAGTDATTITFQGTDTYIGRATTDTVINKRVTRRFITTTQSATPTINTDNTDIASITGLAQAITSMTTNLTGTPVAGDYMQIQITDNGTARAITWGAKFASTTTALPTTTVISTLLRVGFQWNTVAAVWQCIAVA
jgi:hypothetical protein